MRKAPLKALVSLLILNRTEGAHPNWDRIVLVASTAVTIGLIALYTYEKSVGRWSRCKCSWLTPTYLGGCRHS